MKMEAKNFHSESHSAGPLGVSVDWWQEYKLKIEENEHRKKLEIATLERRIEKILELMKCKFMPKKGSLAAPSFSINSESTSKMSIKGYVDPSHAIVVWKTLRSVTKKMKLQELQTCRTSLRELTPILKKIYSDRLKDEAHNTEYIDTLLIYNETIQKLNNICSKLERLAENNSAQKKKICMCMLSVISNCLREDTASLIDLNSNQRLFKIIPPELKAENSTEKLKLEEELNALYEQYGQLEISINAALKNRQFSDIQTLSLSKKQILDEIYRKTDRMQML